MLIPQEFDNCFTIMVNSARLLLSFPPPPPGLHWQVHDHDSLNPPLLLPGLTLAGAWSRFSHPSPPSPRTYIGRCMTMTSSTHRSSCTTATDKVPRQTFSRWRFSFQDQSFRGHRFEQSTMPQHEFYLQSKILWTDPVNSYLCKGEGELTIALTNHS